jgi:hypothetical protein
MSPATEELHRLTRLGFYGDPIFDADGQLSLLHYVHDMAGLRDVVVVSAGHSAHAYRTSNPFDPREPFQIAPQAIQWHQNGDVVTVVHALLSLPHPAAEAAPKRRASVVASATNGVVELAGSSLARLSPAEADELAGSLRCMAAQARQQLAAGS